MNVHVCVGTFLIVENLKYHLLPKHISIGLMCIWRGYCIRVYYVMERLNKMS